MGPFHNAKGVSAFMASSSNSCLQISPSMFIPQDAVSRLTDMYQGKQFHIGSAQGGGSVDGGTNRTSSHRGSGGGGGGGGGGCSSSGCSGGGSIAPPKKSRQNTWKTVL